MTTNNQQFRFNDNRSKYLLFVTTSTEKAAIANRVGRELEHLHPEPPALRIFDAGMGDATVLTKVMRDLHYRYPTIPLLVVAKEISLEDVRLGLDSMADRFIEHPQTVLVVTNMKYSEAPSLTPRQGKNKQPLKRYTVTLEGDTGHEFDQQLRNLDEILTEGWRVTPSAKTGNPLYVHPSMLVIYRKDHEFALHGVIPQEGMAEADQHDHILQLEYDLILAIQPFRAGASAEKKINYVLAPLARSLSQHGRMLVIQSAGYDPGMEIIRKLWPEEKPFKTPRHELIEAMKAKLSDELPDLIYTGSSSDDSLFQYRLNALPDEMTNIGTSSLLAAWNAAVYVAQIDDQRVDEAMVNGKYLDAVRDVVRQHGGLWFMDESFVVCRQT